jgi:hypothetical protein
MMRKIAWSISLDPSETEGIIEVSSTATYEEIEEAAKEAAFNGLDWGWSDSPKAIAETESRL